VAGARLVGELLNGVLTGKRRADVLLVANARTRAALPRPVDGVVLELVENGVDLEVFSQREAAAERVPLSEPGAPARPTTFVYLGRLVDWKRVDLLLRAFARAAPQAPMRLVVVGSGQEEVAL